MASDFRYEVDEDPCEICVGPVLIEYKRDRTAQGAWLRWIPQRAWCASGCEGRRALDEMCVRRHIA
jgi:hypothetical protein